MQKWVFSTLCQVLHRICVLCWKCTLHRQCQSNSDMLDNVNVFKMTNFCPCKVTRSSQIVWPLTSSQHNFITEYLSVHLPGNSWESPLHTRRGFITMLNMSKAKLLDSCFFLAVFCCKRVEMCHNSCCNLHAKVACKSMKPGVSDASGNVLLANELHRPVWRAEAISFL